MNYIPIKHNSQRQVLPKLENGDTNFQHLHVGNAMNDQVFLMLPSNNYIHRKKEINEDELQMKPIPSTSKSIQRKVNENALQMKRGEISKNSDSNFISKESPQNSKATSKPKDIIVPISVGGDTESKKIIRIAWTFDDGPTAETAKMKKAFTGAVGSTWYIQYHHLKPGNPDIYKKKIAELKTIQANKGEIALHGLHPKNSHAFWFPSKSHDSFKSIQETMKALETFQNALTKEGIKTKFVRLPGGLISEISAYLNKLATKGDVNSIAREIIKGNKVVGTNANKVKSDFEFMKMKLQSLGLHLWGGSNEEAKVMTQSWEAETSGNVGRVDNTTEHVHSSRIGEDNGKPGPGKFERTVDKVTEARSRSLVILAHDTTAEDAKEVGEDNKKMNSYAKEKKVKIEYHTMSNLFKKITGQNP